MIITIAATKGGVGKTTIATSIAAHLAQCSKRVALVDADSFQASTHKWAHYRKNKEDNLEVILTHLPDLRDFLRDLSKKYDAVIVDAAGRDSDQMQTALKVSDLALHPTSTNMLDLQELTTIRYRVEQAQEVNPELRSVWVLNKCSTNVKLEAKTKEAYSFICEAGGVVLNTWLHNRDAWDDVYAMGLGITEWSHSKSTKAKDEFNVLTDFIDELLIGEV